MLARVERATFDAIAELEREIGHPLGQALEAAALALGRQGFSARIGAAKANLPPGEAAQDD